jgi:hypothetical protein
MSPQGRQKQNGNGTHVRDGKIKLQLSKQTNEKPVYSQIFYFKRSLLKFPETKWI